MKTTTYKLGEVLDNFDYLRKPLSSMERASFQGEYPYYGAQGIIDYVREYRCDGTYMLIAEDGENLSSRKEPIALIAKGKFWVNNHAHIVKTNELADLNYICYLLNHSDIAGYITGSAQPKLSQGNLNKIKISLPSLPLQRRIASILSAYDNLIEANSRRIKILEQMAENLYKEWFAYKKIHNSAKQVKIKDIISITRGISYSSAEIDCEDGVDLINLKNIQGFGGFRLDGTKKYNGKYKSSQIVKTGDLVMGVTDMTQDRRTVGHVALIPHTSNVSVISADLIKLSSQIDSTYLYVMFRYGNVSRHISQFANGSNVLHLRPQVVENVKILLPEQELIDKFVSIIKPIFSQINTLQRQSANLTRQRDLLLPRLMSGQLTPLFNQ